MARSYKTKKFSPDISPTAGQMPRLLGLAYASKLFRQNKDLHKFNNSYQTKVMRLLLVRLEMPALLRVISGRQ